MFAGTVGSGELVDDEREAKGSREREQRSVLCRGSGLAREARPLRTFYPSLSRPFALDMTGSARARMFSSARARAPSQT